MNTRVYADEFRILNTFEPDADGNMTPVCIFELSCPGGIVAALRVSHDRAEDIRDLIVLSVGEAA